jgi:chromosomal replication initiator protein
MFYRFLLVTNDDILWSVLDIQILCRESSAGIGRATPVPASCGEAAVTDPTAAELWEKTCSCLRQTLRPDVYSRWIAVITPAALSEHTLTLAVANDFYQSWLEENYLGNIHQALSMVSPRPLKLAFTVNPAMSAPAAPPPRRKPARERPSRSDVTSAVLNSKLTFSDFIVGPSNSFAHAAAIAVAQAPARAYNPLFIYGGVGLGKTHLMQAIGHHVLGTSRATLCYLSSELFLNEYIDALQSRTTVQFRKKYRSVDLLLIDDIHFLASKERLQEEFFHTFNTLFDARKQIVMTSDRPASEIAGLEKRLVSRFEWGLVTEIEPPDIETRLAILRHKQAQAQITLPNDILLFIAENVRSNIRRLEGALVRTLSYTSLTGRPITLDVVRNLIRDILEQEKKGEITFALIQKAVAEHYDVRLTDMTSKRRQRSVAVPRQVAMFLCRRMTRASLPDIANAFGKTHATVLHACKVVNSRLDVDGTLRKNIESISGRLERAETCS